MEDLEPATSETPHLDARKTEAEDLLPRDSLGFASVSAESQIPSQISTADCLPAQHPTMAISESGFTREDTSEQAPDFDGIIPSPVQSPRVQDAREFTPRYVEGHSALSQGAVKHSGSEGTDMSQVISTYMPAHVPKLEDIDLGT